MLPAEQLGFVEEMFDRIREEVLAQVPKMPDTWNGVQIRQYIADKFASQTWKMDRAAKKSYDADRLSHNIE